MLPEETSLLLTRSPLAVRGSESARLNAKVLAASVLRNLPLAELKVVRTLADPGDWKPLFRVERAGLEERGSGSESSGGPWEAVSSVDGVEDYPWVFFLESGSLLLRGIDHLLAGEADILWAPLTGVPVTAERCNAALQPEEREPGYRVERPHSRPWREAASPAVWAVRGEHVRTVMAEWERLTGEASGKTDLEHMHRADGTCCGGDPHGGASKEAGSRARESAWNRLLMDTPLRVARFERDEVQFPCLPGADFLRWKDAAILNVSDWPADAQSKFLQAWFYGTYFADPSGLFLDIVEP